MKIVELNNENVIFETLDQLVEMLKEDYEVTLHIRKKGKIKAEIVRL